MKVVVLLLLITSIFARSDVHIFQRNMKDRYSELIEEFVWNLAKLSNDEKEYDVLEMFTDDFWYFDCNGERYNRIWFMDNLLLRNVLHISDFGYRKYNDLDVEVDFRRNNKDYILTIDMSKGTKLVKAIPYC